MFKKLPLLMMAVLLTLCSNTYAFYMNTTTVRATGNPGTDTTGWVNNVGTKVDNSMIVSASGLQRSWAVFKPNLALPVGAVIASVNLVFNITNVSSPGSASCKINILNQDASQYVGPTLYNALDPAPAINVGSWGNVPGQFTASLSPVTMSSYLSLPAITIAWIQFAGTNIYNISGETSGNLAPYLVINWYVPCSGTPSGGTASSSASPVCNNTPYTLTDVGYTVDTGMTYQWQSSTVSNAGPWTDVNPNGNNPALLNVASQTQTTYYRLKTTCTFNSNSGYSNVVTVTQNPPTSCYCIPAPGAGGCSSGDGIHTFTLVGEGPGITDFATGCHANAYDDRTLESVTMMQCVSYSGIISKITNNGQQDNLRIWIDFNDDGIFSTTESVCTATNITDVYPGPNNFTINIPPGATTGNHRMRVMMGRGAAPASFDPCNAGPVWNFGETHDYTANIIPIIILNTPIIAGNSDYCVGTCVQLTANVANANAGTQYIWTYPPLFTPVITSNPTLNICPSALNNTGLFSVRAFYGCDTTAAGTLNVTIHAQPVATPSSNSPVCTGSTLLLDGDNNAYTYEWYGPVSYYANLQHSNRPSMLIPYAGDYSMVVTDPATGCKDTFTTNVQVIQTPVIGTIMSNPTNCVPGNDGSITITGLTPGNSYTINYTGPMSGSVLGVASPTGQYTISGLVAGSYNVWVASTTVPICTSALQFPTLTNPSYNITLNTITNPTTCVPGNDGKIKITGVTTNVTYELFWTDPQGNTHDSICTAIANSLTMNGFTAGNVTNIYIIKGGCQSNVLGPVVLTNPVYNINSVSPTQPSNCVPGCNGSLLLCGLPANTSGWTGVYQFNAAPETIVPNLTANASGCVNLPNLCEGSYTNIYLVRNGCTTNIWAGPYVLANPVYTLSGVTATDPTTCGNTGCFKICGLPPSTGGFTVHYLDPLSNSLTSGVVPTDVNGCISICSLGAGTYDNIYVTKGGCTSNAVGPVTLTNPANPTVTANSNSPVCTGDDINFTGGSAGNTIYQWKKNPDNVTVLANSMNWTIPSCTLGDAGTYKIVVTAPNGCKDSTTTVVVVNETPVLTGITYTNPTKCATCNGTFTISGLKVSTNYTLHYLKNAVPQTVNITSTATGTYVRGGQCAGTYDNIYVTSAANCISNALGPITLVDPPLPPQPGANSNSPVCAGDTMKLTSNSLTYNAAYRWSGPAAFGSNIAGQNQNVPNVTAAYAGNYSVTVRDTFNCTSLPTVINVQIKPQPVISISSNTPVCIGQTLELYSNSDIPGSTVLWNYPDGPTSALDSPTRPGAITPYAGTYTVHYTSSFGCSSQATTDVFIGNILLSGLQASSNSPLCSGDTLKLDAGVLVPGAQYSWTGPNGFNTPIADPIRTDVQVVDSGDYIVSAILNGCQSAPDTTHVVIRPTTTATVNITAFPGDTICVGDNVTFTATVTNGGSTPSYQWVKNGFWVLGATDSFWGSPNLVNNTDIFVIFKSSQVCVTNPVDTSNTIHITLGNLVTPSVVLTASANIILPGQPIDFTATVVNAGPNPTFEWFKNGILIPGATTNMYTAYNLTQNDQIKVVVHSSWTCAAVDTASAFWGNPNVTTGTASVTGKESAITMFPNPNNGSFTVEGVFKDITTEKNIPVEVLNSLGQVVYRDQATIANSVLRMQFNLVDMPGGMYVLRLMIGNETRLLRFTIR